jgi:GT2 family glycosyltransferase
MAVAVAPRRRASVDGKFFRLGEKKFYVKGVAYGPFRDNEQAKPFASKEQTAADFAQIRQLEANLIRIYDVPPKWFLDLALEHKLKLLIDIPWNKHLCFIDSPAEQDRARQAVRNAVLGCGGHPAIFAFSVANEVPPDIVRWSGTQAVSDFIDELVQEAKHADPQCLCTFTNFPPTEFLHPACVDFVCFNVYLHQEAAFKNYLARLQMQADSKPLILGEFGIDSIREGEQRKCELLSWQVEAVFRGGLAGGIVFSYTDDWWRGGAPIEDWAMGLTTRQRQPKESFYAVQKAFRVAPYFRLPRYPRVSVVVAAYNADRTLKACLESLQQLKYPDYEVVLVDDGSTDTTPQIAFLQTYVRHVRHERNLGLSAARNTGIEVASGEIIAFTDADCRTDEDWLYYLSAELMTGEFAAMGGPNLLPPEDSAVAAAVMASPGGPAHVMLSDRQAEHIPGCNMAFFKWVLRELGGFDAAFRRAGDDVDLCWRLQQAGYKIGFSPAAFVWHFRRSTVVDYLKQQHGYGEAEALLVRKHPEYFNSFGGSIWRGRIYTSSKFGLLLRGSIIYRGLFGSAGFQSLYAAEPALTLMLCTTLEYHVLVTLPLWILSAIWVALLPIAITTLLVPLAVCCAAAAQATLPREKLRWWSRPLVALLYFLQPIVRGWARYQGRLFFRPTPLAAQQTLESVALRESGQSVDQAEYWSSEPINRLAFVADVLRHLDRQGWPNKSDIGWCDYDVEIYGSRWSSVQLTTVEEEHPRGQRLIRCRLRPRWSLAAKVAFALLAGLDFLVLGFGAHRVPWFALVLLTLPLFAWLIHREQRALQSLLIIFLDGLAAEWKMTRTSPQFALSQPAPETSGSLPLPARPHNALAPESPAPEKIPHATHE